MATLYKEMGEPLPTVIFDGDSMIEFLRVPPDRFEFETKNQELIDKLVAMGYRTVLKGRKAVAATDTPADTPVDPSKAPKAPRIAKD